MCCAVPAGTPSTRTCGGARSRVGPRPGPTLSRMPSRVPLRGELAAALGVPVQATRLGSSPRSRVWRVGLRGGRRVIVKQIADEGGAGADGDARYAREVAALRLAARATRPAVAPALLAVDPGSRVIVLEYVNRTGPAGDWMPEFAVALARL